MASRPAQTLEGAVKWFEPDKGYGFIAPDGGGKDIFIHVTALRRSGVERWSVRVSACVSMWSTAARASRPTRSR